MFLRNAFLSLSALGLIFNPIAGGVAAINQLASEDGGGGGSTVYNVPSQAELLQVYAAYDQSIEDQAATEALYSAEIGQYLVQSDGYYDLAVPTGVNLSISPKDVLAVQKGLELTKQGVNNDEFIVNSRGLYLADFDAQYVINGGRNDFQLKTVKVWGITIITGVSLYLNDMASTIWGSVVLLAGISQISRITNALKTYYNLSATCLTNVVRWVSNTLYPIVVGVQLGMDAVLVATSASGIGLALAAVLKLTITLTLNLFAAYAVGMYIGHGYPIVPGLIGSGRGTITSMSLKGGLSIKAQ